MDTGSIRQKLGDLRTKLRLLLAGHGVVRVLSVAAGLAAISFVMDWLFQLPWGARVIMLIIMVAVLAWTVLRHIVRPFSVSLDDESMALLVERRHPEFGHELISALQLSEQMEDDENSDSREMMSTAVAQAVHRFKGMSFGDSLSARPLAGPAFLGIAALLLLVIYASVLPEHASLWFDRCIRLSDREWPPKTRLEVRIANIGKFRHEIRANGHHEVWVPEASVIRVEVRAEGDIPSSVRLKKYVYPRSENPTPVTVEMGERSDSGEFEYKFGRVTSSFEFYAEGGDDEDEVPYFVVHVRSAPRVDSFEVAYDYPDYINEVGQKDRSGVREYNLIAPVGTEATMSFRVSSPLQHFALILDDDPENPIALQPLASDPLQYRWKKILERDHFYTYRLIGENGTPSREVPNFNISAQVDLPPQLGVVMPELTNIDVTARAILPLKIQVSDDFGIGGIELRWDSSRDGLFTQAIAFDEEDLQFENEEQRELIAFRAIEMRQFTIVDGDKTRPLRAGDSIFLKIEARDRRSTSLDPEPNISVYPTLLLLNLRETSEIERDLVRGQVRTKEQVERALEAAELRRDELKQLVDGGQANQAGEDAVHSLIAGQALVTSSLSEAARGFVRIFDGYLFNRTDPSNLTESLIASICNRHRREAGTHYEFITATLPEVENRIDQSEAMGKLTRIMGLLIRAADRESPALGLKLREATQVANASERLPFLEEALREQEQLLATLRSLVDKMEEWEDFQDVIQSLKDILELQKGLSDRVESLPK
ncbi:MAG: hypothetical protein V3W41_03955 [Planctomycetota bacterium]